MQAQTSEIKPLITESSTAESTTVEVVMNDLRDGVIHIPDYQRDSDQWSDQTKSLLVESVINNLSIPAFFFEVQVSDLGETNSVIDGQQRLTTLFDFYDNRFELVSSDDAPYLTPHSVHYAGKYYRDLPPIYQQAFKKYRLTIIKLRNVKDMRLEIFRRINQGGTPLSGQDIRLAYYGDDSASVTFIRLVGVYDTERQASSRFRIKASEKFGFPYPWNQPSAQETWKEWWQEKDIAHGQKASEMFLWALVSCDVNKLADLLQNAAALQTLNCRFNKSMEEVLDVYCAQLRYQDTHKDLPPLLASFSEISKDFFPFFQEWLDVLLSQKGPSLPVSKHRLIASVIGASYRMDLMTKDLTERQWTDVVEFIRRPSEIAKALGVTWPVSKGRWDGRAGYRTQIESCHQVLQGIIE